MVTLNGKDISDLFKITCKKCGSEDVDIQGYSNGGYGGGGISCNNCDNSVDEVE